MNRTEEKEITLEDLKEEIRRIDPDLAEDDDGYNAVLVLLASLAVGPEIKRIAKFTGLRRDLVAWYSRNLRASGVWKRGKIYADWFDEENGGVALLLDASVAQGYVKRVPLEAA